MAKRKARDENSSYFKSLLNDREDPSKGFKDIKPPVLNITQKGEPVGKERGQPRFLNAGVVFVHLSNEKTLRADCHDLSLSGIGICINKKLKNYRIGSKVTLEFAQPHALHGLLIEAELKRVAEDANGVNRLGFRISSPSRWARKKIREVITRLSDPWGP
ncbi:MAG: PilZ domain-containing protein [Bdellovibrionales bacterium]